jgi:isoleucyl-tRNA synthetase
VHNFCVQELGGFYLDVIKDRQYTTGRQRGAALLPDRTVPHCRGTGALDGADPVVHRRGDLWEYLPGARGNESVMLNGWYDGLSELPEGFELDRAFWERVMAVKVSVNKEMENLRAAKAIGGNLQAKSPCMPKTA